VQCLGGIGEERIVVAGDDGAAQDHGVAGRSHDARILIPQTGARSMAEDIAGDQRAVAAAAGLVYNAPERPGDCR
jgi:hypothetical protein